jgi:hypothetical protein
MHSSILSARVSLVSQKYIDWRQTNFTSQWSGWIIQQYNSGAIAMGALGEQLFEIGKPYWMIPFAVFIGLFIPLPFFLVHRYAPQGSKIATLAQYVNTPIILLYIGQRSVGSRVSYLTSSWHRVSSLLGERSMVVLLRYWDGFSVVGTSQAP